MTPWREFALQLGVRSSVALPLGSKPGASLALLVLYSRYPGGFSSDAQQAFVAQLKTLLDLALARLAPDRPGTEVLPFTLRERWRERLAGVGVEMHYQPIFALAQGRVVELEALARLRDVDGSLLSPGRFLPALNADDLLRLFREGLRQALAQRTTLVASGHTFDITVNLPPAALYDPRYAAATAAALSISQCPPRALLLEILENASEAEHALGSAVAGMLALKALGVRVAEDDLGAGHSSLARLRQWPFDRVKIDQTLVRDVAADPLRTLRFIRQLTLLGQALGIEVVVEGLETAGLVEAALMLGADFGQGYALARPCAPAALPELLSRLHWSFDAHAPRTALGALAGALLWEERFEQSAEDRVDWQRIAAAPCRVSAYLTQHGAADITLLNAHDAMHSAAHQGPRSADYRASRAHFITVLIAQVRAEEAARTRTP
jgi:EAL domain-containing protein (putative c-di-GMP-specific phosphodiesterase class I)